MEGTESALNRVGRAVWTVWGYLTGTVGRYLRPVVTNEEAKFKQEETVPFNKSYKELKAKEEEADKNETRTRERKTRDDVHNSGISVRAAAVQWEKGNIARDGHEVKGKNKHTYSSSEGIDKKHEAKKDDEKALDSKSELTERDDSPAHTDADVKNRDTRFPACQEAGLNVERSETNQEQTKTQEEEEKMVKRELDETEQEAIKSEYDQERRKKSKDEEKRVGEFMRSEYHETEKPVKSYSFDQDSLTKKINVERSENSQEQSSKEEREDDDAGEEVRSKLLEQGLLTEEADLKAERIDYSQDQGREQEEEGGESKETGEESAQSKLLEQALVAEEADLKAAKIKFSQQQENDQEEEEENEFSVRCLSTKESDLNDVDEVMRRQDDDGEEEAIECEFIEESIMSKEANVNVERNENCQELRRTEEEGLDNILSRDETEEKMIKSIFTEQGLLAKEADLIVERNENNQEHERKQEEEEEEECVDESMMKENAYQGLLINVSDLNVERIENSQEQISKEEEEEERVDEMLRREYDETAEEPIKGKVTKQGFDPAEQEHVCDMGETAEGQVVSGEKMLECVYDQDKNVEERSIYVATEHGHEASASQMMAEGLFSQLTTTCDPLNDSQKLEEDMTENATLMQEKNAIDVDNKETKQETEGKEKDGHHEEFPACEPFTGTDIVGEQKVGDTEMTENLKQVLKPDCKLLETAQTENAEMYKRMSERSTTLEDEHKPTSHVALNVGLRKLEEINQEHNGSQQPAVMTKQDVKGVITRPAAGTGNQMETVETTFQFGAEVAALDVKKSSERETITHEKLIESEDVALQEVMGQWLHKQEFLLIESTDTKINQSNVPKAEHSEIMSVLLEQGNETPGETVDEMPCSSLQELEERSSSPEQTAEMFETLCEVTAITENELKFGQAQPECEISHVEKHCDTISLHETPLVVQINQDEFTMQEDSSHRLQIGDETYVDVPETDSEQETSEMQWNAEKDTEEQERTDEPEAGLLADIKDVTSCSGVLEDATSGLEKESETPEWEPFGETEAPERKDHKSDLESHDETTENNMDVELLTGTWECEKEQTAEMTDIESVEVDTACVVKQMEEPITEEGKETCQLVFSESEQKVDGESAVDGKENTEERGRPAPKRGFKKIAGDDDKDKPSDLLLPSQASILDFRAQKSKIAVKSPLVRPPKDPRTLINMPSVEPLPPHPQPSQPSFLKKSHIEGASVPSKGVIGIKLPGLGAGFPALKKSEAGRKIRDEEDSEKVTSEKSESGSQSRDDNVKQETPTQKPKWTPPKQPGMANPLMMAELKNKLKKPVKE